MLSDSTKLLATSMVGSVVSLADVESIVRIISATVPITLSVIVFIQNQRKKNREKLENRRPDRRGRRADIAGGCGDLDCSGVDCKACEAAQ